MDLARAIGVQAQQIQKYECGANQIYAARLHDLASALSTTIGYFFEGWRQGPVSPGADVGDDLLNRHETTALITTIAALSPRARAALLKLASELAADAAPNVAEDVINR